MTPHVFERLSATLAVSHLRRIEHELAEVLKLADDGAPIEVVIAECSQAATRCLRHLAACRGSVLELSSAEHATRYAYPSHGSSMRSHVGDSRCGDDR